MISAILLLRGTERASVSDGRPAGGSLWIHFTYERDGTYQLYAREIVLDGAGLLTQRFQELKEELEEMGMFAGI